MKKRERLVPGTPYLIIDILDPGLEIVPDWSGLLSSDLAEKEIEVLRRHERTGRPLGSDDFVTGLEKLMSRILKKKKPGSKTK